MNAYKYFTNPYNGLIQRINKRVYNEAKQKLAQGIDTSINVEFLYSDNGGKWADASHYYISAIVKLLKPIDALVVKVFVEDGGYDNTYFWTTKF